MFLNLHSLFPKSANLIFYSLVTPDNMGNCYLFKFTYLYLFADIGISRWRCAYISAEIYLCNFHRRKRIPFACFAFP